MRKIQRLLCMVGFFSTTMFICACGGDDDVVNTPTTTPTPTVAGVEKTNNKGWGKGDTYTIPVDIGIQLEEYSEQENKTGKKADKIECGKRYKLSLVGNGVIELENLKDKEIDLEVRVEIGEENIVHFESYYKNEGGLEFVESEEEKGVYIATCQISKKKNLDFSQGYFVMGVDSIEGVKVNTQPIIVKITPIVSEEEKDIVEIHINGQAVLKNDLTLAKGEYIFTEKDNISYGIGNNVRETTMYIKLPAQSQGVKVDFYNDKERTQHYGSQEFSLIKGEDKVSIVLADCLKEYMSEEKYKEELNKGDKEIYLTITAFGGNSYKDKAIDISYKLE